MTDKPAHPSGRPIRREVVKPFVERTGRRTWPLVERLGDAPLKAGGFGFHMPAVETEWTDTTMRRKT